MVDYRHKSVGHGSTTLGHCKDALQTVSNSRIRGRRTYSALFYFFMSSGSLIIQCVILFFHVQWFVDNSSVVTVGRLFIHAMCFMLLFGIFFRRRLPSLRVVLKELLI